MVKLESPSRDFFEIREGLFRWAAAEESVAVVAGFGADDFWAPGFLPRATAVEPAKAT